MEGFDFRGRTVESQPSWAAWIEIYGISHTDELHARRSPLGLRGLKLISLIASVSPYLSQPSWAAWIEIVTIADPTNNSLVAALLGCVD